MKSVFATLLLALVVTVSPADDGQRGCFSVPVASGWTVRFSEKLKPGAPIQEGTRIVTADQLIVESRGCSVSFTRFPLSEVFTPRNVGRLAIESFRARSPKVRAQEFGSMGPRTGYGEELVCVQEFGITSVVRAFAFEESGEVISLVAIVTEKSEESAIKTMSECVPEIVSMLNGLKITKPANQALQTTPMTRTGSEKTIVFGYPQRGV